MIDALNTAISGIRAAGLRVGETASEVARANVAAGDRAERAGRLFHSGSLSPSAVTVQENEASLTESLVSFREAAFQYKATARLIGALQGTGQELLKALA